MAYNPQAYNALRFNQREHNNADEVVVSRQALEETLDEFARRVNSPKGLVEAPLAWKIKAIQSRWEEFKREMDLLLEPKVQP